MMEVPLGRIAPPLTELNLYKSLKNYTEYIESNIEKDDLYILPLVKLVFPELNDTTFIVFENINLDTRIKMPLDKFKTIKNLVDEKRLKECQKIIQRFVF
jgi:hypothetical protein